MSVAEERRGIRRHAAQLPVREQAALDQRLETVADAEDKAAAGQQVRDGSAHLGVVDDVCNELAASVRFVTGREAAAERQDLAFGNLLRQGVDGTEDILRGEVPEHERPDLGAGLPEGLGGIVVTVGTREHRQADHGMLHRSAGIDHRWPIAVGHDGVIPGLTGNLRDGLVESGLDPRRIELEIAALIGLFQGLQGHFAAIDLDTGIGDDTEFDGTRMGQVGRSFHQGGTVAQGEEILFRNCHVHAESVAHRHFYEALGDAAVRQRPGRYDAARTDGFIQIVPIPFQLLRIRHPVRERGMFQEIDPVACLLELRRDHSAGIDGRDAEGDEGRRHMDVFEGSTHGVLSADGRQTELLLHSLVMRSKYSW